MESINISPECIHDGCSNEGLYFCRVCNLHYCFEHLCIHLLQNQKLPLPTQDSTLFDLDNNSDDTLKDEYTEDELRDASDMKLRSRLNRLMHEAKRVQKELERRMIFATEYYHVRSHTPRVLNYGHPFYANPKDDKNKAAADKLAAKQQKEQDKIKEAVAILAASIKAGASKDQLINKIKKGA